MAAIVNDRDVLLQAASPRVLGYTTPGNETVPPSNLGNGNLPGGVGVPLGNLASGTLPGSISVPALSVSGTLQTYQLSAAVITTLNLSAQSLSANQIVTGTLDAGRLSANVITTSNFYAQTINATQIVAGTMSADRIYGGILKGAQLDISTPTGTSNGYYFRVNSVGYLECGLAIFGGGAIIGQGPDTSTNGAPGLLLHSGYNLQTGGYVSMGGRPQNNKATLWVEAAQGTSDAHAGRFIRRSTAGGTITSSLICGEYAGRAAYAEVGTFGPFTASHEALIAKDEPCDMGELLEDVAMVSAGDISNTIFEVRVASKARSRFRAGVVVDRMPLDRVPAALIVGFDSERRPIPPKNWAELQAKYDLVTMNALGEGMILVCGLAGDIEAGDYVTTSGLRGVAQAQGDDVLRACTVAKLRESITFEHPEEIRLVPCYYHCG